MSAALKVQSGKKVPDFSAHVDVYVSLSRDALHIEGWHHENECPGGPPQGAPPARLADGWTTVEAALRSLHEQAHGRTPIGLCRAEPCSSLSLDQLRGAA